MRSIRWPSATSAVWYRSNADRYPTLMHHIATLPVGPAQDRERHAPVADRIAQVIRRGQRTGEFDDELDAEWLAAAVIALAHSAAGHRDARWLSAADADRTFQTTLWRLLTPPRRDG